jgi:hypothetical protein
VDKGKSGSIEVKAVKMRKKPETVINQNRILTFKVGTSAGNG